MTSSANPASIDWRDLRFSLLVGVVFAVVKALSIFYPDFRIGSNDVYLPFFLTLGYMLHRARREPEKLESWGLTVPTAPAAWAAAFGLLVLGVALIAGMSYGVGGTLSFDASYPRHMVDYFLAGFTQQFFLCSIGLASLAALPVFRGHWRLPLTVGLLFGLAHFWTPAKIPGTPIPLQMIGVVPMGALASYYFLRYRSVVPLSILHAILYVLLSRWVEAYL
ncbi:MAG: hypothetical protein GC168_14695 [Candidatus Hydrogenedens sp.]|nr:hypothetical protein [Candidatus Hydrogenedens sp.]